MPWPLELEELKARIFLVSIWASKDVVVYPFMGWKTKLSAFGPMDISNLLELMIGEEPRAFSMVG